MNFRSHSVPRGRRLSPLAIVGRSQSSNRDAGRYSPLATSGGGLFPNTADRFNHRQQYTKANRRDRRPIDFRAAAYQSQAKIPSQNPKPNAPIASAIVLAVLAKRGSPIFISITIPRDRSAG
jgi:hypothetical protein